MLRSNNTKERDASFVACNYHAVKTQIKASDWLSKLLRRRCTHQKDINLIWWKKKLSCVCVQLRELSKWLWAPIRRSRAPVNIYAQRDGIMRERWAAQNYEKWGSRSARTGGEQPGECSRWPWSASIFTNRPTGSPRLAPFYQIRIK